MAFDRKTALEEERRGYEVRLKGALEANDKDAEAAMRARISQVDELLAARKPKAARGETIETAHYDAPPETTEAPARKGRKS